MSGTGFLEAIALRLAAGAGWVWNTSGVYAPGEVGIVLGAMPEQPEAAITLNLYGEADTGHESQVRVQLRARGGADPREAMGMCDAARPLLHGLHHQWLGPWFVVTSRRISSIPMGRDTNGRHEHATNFHFKITIP